MAVLDWEGFDRETQNLGIFTAFLGDISANNSGAFGYGRYLTRNTPQAYFAARYAAFPAESTLFIQCHFFSSALSSGEWRMGLLDGSTYQVFARIGTDGIPRIVRGDLTILASATQAIQLNTWNFIQLKVTIANSGGSAELRLNGKTVATYTGDTQNTTIASANGWKVEQTSWGAGNNTDNVLVYNATGDAPTTWTPETRIFEALPTGAGFTTEWTPTGAASNWQCVVEQPSDGDTTYVSAATAPLSDLYALPADAVAGGIVYGVAVHATVRKDDAGASNVDGLIRTGGTTFAKGAPVAVTDSYVRQRWLWTVNPATGLAWTVADANAAEAGIRRTS